MKEEIKKELEEIAPLLSKIKKEDTFDIPKNYFEALPEQILGQIDFPKNNTFTTLPKTTTPQKWYAQWIEKLTIFFQPKMAIGLAMMIILVSGAYFLTPIHKPPMAKHSALSETLDQTTDAQLEEYVTANIDNFDEEELFDFVGFDSDGSELDDPEMDDFFNDIIDDIEESDLYDFL